MTATAAAGRTASKRHDPKARSLLVGLETFNLLKRAQERLPAPRLDMRYLVEGALVVGTQEGNRECWIAAAHQALRLHVNSTPESGTVETLFEGGSEGANARNQETSSRAAHDPNCKSLLIGEDAFIALKLLQNTTHSPRLEMRYLVEGAIALLHERPSIQASWVQAARQVLHSHLAVLGTLPVQTFSLEIQA
jgi:hypothetical protein